MVNTQISGYISDCSSYWNSPQRDRERNALSNTSRCEPAGSTRSGSVVELRFCCTVLPQSSNRRFKLQACCSASENYKSTVEDSELQRLTFSQETKRMISSIGNSVDEAMNTMSGQKRIEIYTMQGCLRVKLPGMSTQKEYTVYLYGTEMLLWASNQRKRIKPSYILNIDKIRRLTIVGQSLKPEELSLRIELIDNKYLLICSISGDLEEWITSIKVLCNTLLEKPDICTLTPGKPFLPRGYISALTLNQYSDNGDIILFKSKSLVGPFIRTATNSLFDHVGIILCSSREKNVSGISYLHAVANYGVVSVDWSDFLLQRADRYYSNIAIRKLCCPRWAEVRIRRDLKFLIRRARKINNGYSVRPAKLLARKPNRCNDPFDQERTFFCSELLAEMYQQVGLLKSELIASSYWPNSWTENFGLRLLKNCRLGPEIKIDFSDFHELVNGLSL